MADAEHYLLRSYSTIKDWEISGWQEARLPGEAMLDGQLVVEMGGKLRLAVCDPAGTNFEFSEEDLRRAGVEALVGLGWHTSLSEGFRIGNEKLFKDAKDRFNNMLVAVSAVELDMESGALHAGRMGDCEVWVKIRGEWEKLFIGDTVTKSAREKFIEHGGASLVKAGAKKHLEAHKEVLGEVDAWVWPPMGLDREARLEERWLEDVSEVVVCSDGAELDLARVEWLDDWLEEGIQNRDSRGHPSPHGDIGVLRARRRDIA